MFRLVNTWLSTGTPSCNFAVVIEMIRVKAPITVVLARFGKKVIKILQRWKSSPRHVAQRIVCCNKPCFNIANVIGKIRVLDQCQ
jgi:hypothetical protein